MGIEGAEVKADWITKDAPSWVHSLEAEIQHLMAKYHNGRYIHEVGECVGNARVQMQLWLKYPHLKSEQERRDQAEYWVGELKRLCAKIESERRGRHRK